MDDLRYQYEEPKILITLKFLPVHFHIIKWSVSNCKRTILYKKKILHNLQDKMAKLIFFFHLSQLTNIYELFDSKFTINKRIFTKKKNK